MKVEIDLDLLEKTDLTVNELVFLQIVFNKRPKELYYLRHLGALDYPDLEYRGYIKFDPTNVTVKLREKAILLFKLNADQFKDFYLTFPQTTPSGRNLRTKDINTNLYRTCRTIWTRLFKGKPDEAEKAIHTLKQEIAYRTATGELEYFTRIDNWLERGMYDYTYDMSKIQGTPSSSLGGFDDM